MSVDDLVTDPEELRAAVEAGMRITIFGGTGPKEETSLAFLAPIITEVRDLWIGTATKLTDLEILNAARNLRSLGYESKSASGQADLSVLPQLEEFGGIVTRAVGSVLENPALRYLDVYGPIPKSFMNVAGQVEIFSQEGGRSQTELPSFAQPQAMRSLTRVSTARFDVARLAEMTGLREFELALCDDVTGLSTLRNLPALESLAFKACVTRERWEELPDVQDGLLLELTPKPSAEYMADRRQSGWAIYIEPDSPSGNALTVDEAGDGESWGVFMSRFEDLADAVDLFDGSAASGLHGEWFLLGVVAELRAEGAELDPEPDSESGFTAVYFPVKSQAEQVYARARELLAEGPAIQLRYLQSGAA